MNAVLSTVPRSLSILDAFSDPQLLGNSFGGDSREAWRAVLSGAFGLPMDAERRELFDLLAGGREPPTQRVRELWAIAGRRSDKTHTAAGIAVYLATVWVAQEGILSRLAVGERGVVQIIACDRAQAKVALNYVRGLIDDSRVLSGMVTRDVGDAIELNNGTAIEVITNSHRAVRGRTLLAAILDECAFFRDESSASPDAELYRAILPSLATTGGLLVGISSPYAKRGLLYDRWRKHFGQNGDVLVVQGASKVFNPTIPQELIDEADAADPDASCAEWHGQFRADVEAFITREIADAVTRPSPLVLPYDRKHRYRAFIDAAGGGADEFTMAIGHDEDGKTIVDVLLAQRGTPSEIVADYAKTLRTYCISEATSDRYGGSWPCDEFARHGIRVDTSAKPKSDLYRDALPIMRSGRCELPPDDKLLTQLVGLERRTQRGGRDSIDHAPNGHDDRANVIAGLLTAKPASRYTLKFI